MLEAYLIQDQLVIEKVEGINGILPYSMNIPDWDADGFKDLIIPF